MRSTQQTRRPVNHAAVNAMGRAAWFPCRNSESSCNSEVGRALQEQRGRSWIQIPGTANSIWPYLCVFSWKTDELSTMMPKKCLGHMSRWKELSPGWPGRDDQVSMIPGIPIWWQGKKEEEDKTSWGVAAWSTGIRRAQVGSGGIAQNSVPPPTPGGQLGIFNDQTLGLSDKPRSPRPESARANDVVRGSQ